MVEDDFWNLKSEPLWLPKTRLFYQEIHLEDEILQGDVVQGLIFFSAALRRRSATSVS